VNTTPMEFLIPLFRVPTQPNQAFLSRQTFVRFYLKTVAQVSILETRLLSSSLLIPFLHLGDPGEDNYHNYMDYAPNVCQVLFTPIQQSVMAQIFNTYRRGL
jgi:hypothetical protein